MYLEIKDELSIVSSANGSDTMLSDRAKKILEGEYFTQRFVDDQYGIKDSEGKMHERIKVYPQSDSQSITVTTVGTGHGIGMSHAGALVMSANGMSFTEILDFYFPGTTIGTIK